MNIDYSVDDRVVQLRSLRYLLHLLRAVEAVSTHVAINPTLAGQQIDFIYKHIPDPKTTPGE